MGSQDGRDLIASLEKLRRSSPVSSTGEPKEKCSEFIQGVYSSKGQFIIVEGGADKKFYEQWCRRNGVNVTVREIGNIEVRSLDDESLIPGANNTEVISLSLALTETHKRNAMTDGVDDISRKIFCIVDRDYGVAVEKFKELQEHFLIFTDFPALESYTLTEANVQKILEGCSACKDKHDAKMELDHIFKELFIYWQVRQMPSDHPGQSYAFNKLKRRRRKSKNSESTWSQDFEALESTIDKRTYCYGHDIANVMRDHYVCVKNSYKDSDALEAKFLEASLSDESLKDLQLFRHIITKFGVPSTSAQKTTPVSKKSLEAELNEILATTTINT